MSEDDQLELLIEQTINGVVATFPIQFRLDRKKDTLKVDNPKEFVHGIIIGMVSIAPP